MVSVSLKSLLEAGSCFLLIDKHPLIYALRIYFGLPYFLITDIKQKMEFMIINVKIRLLE